MIKKIENHRGKYRQYAIGLIIAGIFGLILTALFFLFDKPGMFHTATFREIIIFKYKILYYISNSILTLLAGIFLVRLKKIGIFFLISTFVLMISSVFVNIESKNLFLSSTFDPFFLGIFSYLLLFIPPLGILLFGGLFFVGTISINMLRIGQRFKIINSKKSNSL